MPRILFIPLLFVLGNAFATEWAPLDPGELAQKIPKVEADADSEVIFWDVHVSEDSPGTGYAHTVLSNYRRIKVFNARGRDFWSTVRISYEKGATISDLAARTVHPDGSIAELGQDAFSETVAKTGNRQIASISFTMPSVEPGSIIEYRWTETRIKHAGFATTMRLDFQLDNVPIQVVRYWIKPYTAPGFNWTMHIWDLHCSPTLELEGGGTYLATLSNVPALRREPWMPPVDQVRAWALIYYTPSNRQEPGQFWDYYRKASYNRIKARIKAGKDLRAVAEGITAKSKSPEEKLNALSDFCRSRIRNINTVEVTAQEREEAGKSKSPEDTLARGIGSPDDIRYLFAALASAEGFDARWALAADRNEATFDVNFTDVYFIRRAAVAVKLDDGWRFYDPSSTFVPHGMVAAELEGVPSLLCDLRDPAFLNMPASTADQNVERFRGSLRLAEDGSIEGDLEKDFTGHSAASRKNGLLGQSDEQRKEAVKGEITATLTTAEVSDIGIENAADPEKPLIYRCHVRVAGYAQKAGKRLFFVPDVFRQNVKPVFTAATRKNPVYFPYARTEDDEVTIEVPSSFEFEEPRVPPAIRLGPLGGYEVHAHIQHGKTLVYTRRLLISQPGGATVPAESYRLLKGLFDAIANADVQTLSLRQSVAPTAGHQ
jgi:transglutaminase-like putative cysteine protease